MSLPAISVLVIAYNHERYITECLNSILQQDYPGEIQIVIGEDGSPDQTRQTILEAIRDTPSNFQVDLLPDAGNLGMMPNFMRTYAACKHEYVAVCEGDDYWIDSKKLRKQVEFLSQHKEFTVCHHPALLNRNGKVMKDDIIRSVPEVSNFSELLKGNFMHTATVVFRKQFDQLPPWSTECTVGDYLLHLLNTQNGGKIKRLNMKSAVYRVHDGGVWSEIDHIKKLKFIVKYLSVLVGKFGDEADQAFKLRMAETNMAIYNHLITQENEAEADQYLRDATQHFSMEELIHKLSEKELASPKGLPHLWLQLKKTIKKALNG